MGAYGDYAHDVLLLSDGKLMVVGFAGNGGLIDTTLVKFNTDGTLDTSFGSGGWAVSSIVGLEQGYSAVELPNGKIAVSGTTGTNFFIMQFNANGSRDNTFGVSGQMTVDWASGNDQSLGLVAQPDGKLVAVGHAWNGTSFDVAMARFNSNGTLDTTFGTAGRVNTDVGTDSNDRGTAIQILPDGKFLVGGWGDAGGTIDFYLLRYNSDGSLDTTFGGGDGMVNTPVGSGSDFGLTMSVQADGKIVVGGYSSNNGSNFTAIRYNADGTLDNTFGTAGIADIHFGGSSDDRANAVAIQADGKIVLVGSSTLSGSTTGAILRLDANGALDTRFVLSDSLGGTVNYTENGSPVVLDSNVQIFDGELSAADNFSGATVMLARNGGASSEDALAFDGVNVTTSGANVLVGGVTVGTYTFTGGEMAITFSANATNARVNTLMQNIVYWNTSDTPQSSV